MKNEENFVDKLLNHISSTAIYEFLNTFFRKQIPEFDDVISFHTIQILKTQINMQQIFTKGNIVPKLISRLDLKESPEVHENVSEILHSFLESENSDTNPFVLEMCKDVIII